MTARCFTDVLTWDALVAPGVVLCKDGSLLGGWVVQGIDTESLDPDAVQALRGQIAAGLSHLGDAHTLWTVWHRRPWVPETLLADTGGTALDVLADETNEIFAARDLVWTDSLRMFLVWSPEEATQAGLSARVAAFEAACEGVESWIDPVLGLRRIDAPGSAGPETEYSADIVQDLAALLGQDRAAPRIDSTTLPVGLDALLAPAVRQGRVGGPLHVDGRRLAVMTLAGEREVYRPAPLEPIQNLALPLIWISRYRALSPRSALAETMWKRRTWNQAAANLASNIEGSGHGDRSRFADRMSAATEDTRESIETGADGYGHWLSVLLCYATDRPETPDAALRALREQVQMSGFTLVDERAGAVPALLAALPGHATATPRETMVRAQVAADLMPVRGLWPGSRICPSPLLPANTPALLPALTRAGELHHFNLHHGDVGHTLVFGPTGTGKSVLLGHLAAAWLRYPEAQVIVFDRGRSMRYATAALGGVFLEPGIGGASGIAPLSRIGTLGQAWALEWLSEMVRLDTGTRPDPDHRQALSSALGLLDETSASLTALAEQVQDRLLRQVLQGWISGPRAGAFDSAGTDIAGGLDAAPLTVFETRPLFEAGTAVSVLALDYIFAEVAARFDGRPTLVVIDEAWFFLAHDIFVERIRYWLKEGRKMNVAVVMATQSVSDAARSTIIADLLESCPTRLYLASPTATTLVNAPKYCAVGLDPTEIATVAGLRPKREMLMVQDQVRRVLAFPLAGTGLSLLGRTAATDSARAAQRAADTPDFWKEDLENEETVRRAIP